MKKGLFIVLEGIDGSGTTTQINFLHDYFKSLSKYNDVLTTHEPWKSKEIKEMLEKDSDAYSNGEKMAELYVLDRKNHLENLINPVLKQGGIVLTDRYHLSTYGYQGTQGISFDKVKDLHEKHKIKNPDLTIFLDVDYETTKKRIKKRGESLEKFEKNENFTKALIKEYNSLFELTSKDQYLLGPMSKINGNRPIEEVAENIKIECDGLYDLALDYGWIQS